MWPQTLQITEEDCRSMLRRIELETYANVMGCFRAQGGLNEKKIRLLEELRVMFHISQDRHRAEARRVANDEHLSTIAKVVSGPNTWQEWSREGRRSYPMLPRMAPQTALGWIANNLASEAALENAKLPYPAETGASAIEEQAAILAANGALKATGLEYSEKYVVKSDPFKVPDIPASGIKKNLKRTMNDVHNIFGSSLSKKRYTNDSQGLNKTQKHLDGLGGNLLPNNRKSVSVAKLQQQRFFYQQQQKAKKLAKAASKRSEKLAAGAVKSGRKSKKLKEQLNQQIIQQEEQISQQDLSTTSYENQLLHQLGHLDTSTNNVGISGDTIAYQEQEQQPQQQQQQQQQQHIEGVASDQKDSPQKSFYLPLAPQIAASKRDITRNLTKLQIPGQAGGSGQRLSSQLELNSSGPNQSSAIASTGGSKTIVDGKVAPLSTPVQKYIVEDRQPQVPGGHTTSPALITSTTQAQFTSLPHLSTPSKLRATTLLPPGTKLASASSKKLGGPTILSATVLSPGNSPENMVTSTNTTPQMFSLMDSGGGGGGVASTNSPLNSQAAPSAPTHAPPAVIQLHSSEVVRVGSQPTTAATPAQSKVLTTKILPSGSIVSSSSNFGTNSSGTTIIKSLPPAMFVTNQQQQQQQQSGLAGNSAVFSSFGSTGSVYRKPPNILKSSSSSLSRNSPSSGAPQILSNIRLTPAITTGSTTTSSNYAVHQTQSSAFHQQLRRSSTSGIRTSVKICQSSNGKVFIQPANVDTSKLTKLPSGHIPQRILPGTLLGNSATNLSNASGNLSSNQASSPHRIAIQKVQIIPAPLSGSTLGNVTQALQQQQQQQRLVSSSLVVGTGGSGSNKPTFSGNIFMPTGSGSGGGGLRTMKSASNTITLTKANFSASQNELLSGNLVTKSLSEMVNKPSNVVVIDATASAGSKIIPQHTKLSTSSSNNISRSSLNNSQMITEDTPVDIIDDNSPHIVSADADTTDAIIESSSITAVLASNMHENAQQKQPQQQQQQQLQKTLNQKEQPITVLNATDWEMELDQATAASITHNQQTSGSTLIGGYNKKVQQQQQQHTIQVGQTESEMEKAETIIIDDNFDDVIIEEEEGEGEGEEEEEVTTETENYDDHEEGREEDMDIEATHDAEIIMVDSRSSLEDEEGKSSDGFEQELNIRRTIMLSKSSFKSLLPMNENKVDTASDDSFDRDRLDLFSPDNVSINYDCISDNGGGELEPDSKHTDDTQRLTQVGDINCNNHEGSEKCENPHQFGNAEERLLNDLSRDISPPPPTNVSTTMPTKTTVSASLYSVKSTAKSMNTTNEHGDKETSSMPIDIIKENQSSSSDQ